MNNMGHGSTSGNGEPFNPFASHIIPTKTLEEQRKSDAQDMAKAVDRSMLLFLHKQAIYPTRKEMAVKGKVFIQKSFEILPPVQKELYFWEDLYAFTVNMTFVNGKLYFSITEQEEKKPSGAIR